MVVEEISKRIERESMENARARKIIIDRKREEIKTKRISKKIMISGTLG